MATAYRLSRALLVAVLVFGSTMILAAQVQFAISVTAQDSGYVKARCDFGCIGPSKREMDNTKVTLMRNARNKIEEQAQGSCEATAQQRGLLGGGWGSGITRKVFVADYSIDSTDCTIGDHVTFWHSGPGSALVSCQATAKVQCQVAAP